MKAIFTDSENDLFTWRAPSVPVATSMEAARDIERVRGELCQRVLNHVKSSHGATCDECEKALGMSHQTASARLRDLEKAGMVCKTEQRRRTRSGRSAFVYAVRG